MYDSMQGLINKKKKCFLPLIMFFGMQKKMKVEMRQRNDRDDTEKDYDVCRHCGGSYKDDLTGNLEYARVVN